MRLRSHWFDRRILHIIRAMLLSETAVRRPVATVMFFLAVIILGIISLTRLSVDLLPDISYPKLTIRTSYPNIPPVEVEELVTAQIEQSISTIPGVRRVTSISREGLSLITLEFLWGTNMDIASLNVRQKLDKLRWSLPREAGRPTILRLDPRSRPVMQLAVTGGDLVQLKEFSRDVIKRRLEQIKGVALASVTGGFEREILVDVDNRKLDLNDLSIEQVASALDRANHNLPGGTIRKGRYRYALRTLGEFQKVHDLNDVVVAQHPNGTVVLLRDIASVADGFKERNSITHFNGAEAIGLLITKEAGANSVEVSRNVRRVLGSLKKEFPRVTISVAFDQAGFISESIANVIQAVVVGGMLSFMVLFFFLHDFRNPIAIATVIPISILAAFALMFFSGISLNMISLSGLALGVGMLVDNSIVVLENIFRNRQLGMDWKKAAILGTQEVAMPVTASTLTTISVFFPIIYVKGVTGQLFLDQSLTVTFSLLASLLVSLTLLPMFASRYSKATETNMPGKSVQAQGSRLYDYLFQQKDSAASRLFYNLGVPFRFVGRVFLKVTNFLWNWAKALFGFWWQSIVKVFSRIFHPAFNAFDRVYDVFAQKYERLLAWSLVNPAKVISATIVIFTACFLLGLTLDREFMPHVEQREFSLKVELPPGSSLEATNQVVSKIEKILTGNPEISSVFSQIGMTGSQSFILNDDADLNRATLQIRLRDRQSKKTDAVISDLRKSLNAVNGVTLTFETGGNILSQFLSASESDIDIYVSGSDVEQLQRLLLTVQERIEKVKGLTDIHTSFEGGRPEIRVLIDREAVGRYGLSARQVARFVQNYMRGAISTQYKEFDRKIDILVRPSLEARDELTDLLDANIKSGAMAVPIRRLVRIKRTLGPLEIRRQDQVRQVVLYANVQGRPFSEVVREIEQRIAAIEKPGNAQIELGGQRQEMQRSFRSLTFAFMLAAALVYMILAAQFESLVHPFIITFAVPLALIGAVLALFVTGLSVNVMSVIGIVVLIGIVVNDAIVKVDFINQERKRGIALKPAIMEAGRKRLRPILMTTVTTVLGLFPMALGFGGGAALRRPLAVVVIGGLLSATFLTLIVVPVIYALLVREPLK